jgi:hypothetical protein
MLAVGSRAARRALLVQASIETDTTHPTRWLADGPASGKKSIEIAVPFPNPRSSYGHAGNRPALEEGRISPVSNYVFVFRNRSGRALTPEEEARWPRWFEQIGKSIADRGNRVGQARLVGPAPDGEESIGGYIVVNAENLDAAAALAEGCPILGQGGRVEVGEIVPA